MKKKELNCLVKILKRESRKFDRTLVDKIIVKHRKDPYLILICCLLSLRAKDLVTISVCDDLLGVVRSPEDIVKMPLHKLENIIFKVGFYRKKAKVLKSVSNDILGRFDGVVPNTKEELLSINGVGLKTANLVLGLAFNVPAICVDVHVHRISNRLGLIKTKTPEQTEHALMKVLPKEIWIVWNDLLVRWGQNVCTPIAPKCSVCKIKGFCRKINVYSSR